MEEKQEDIFDSCAEEDEPEIQESEEEQKFMMKRSEQASVFDLIQLDPSFNQEFEINEENLQQQFQLEEAPQEEEEEDEKELARTEQKNLLPSNEKLYLENEFARRQKAKTEIKVKEGPLPPMREAKFVPFEKMERSYIKSLPEMSGTIQRLAQSKLLGYLER